MDILRAKTIDIKQTRKLTEARYLNSLLNEKEALNQSSLVDSYPRRFVLELTNACNLNCIMCGRNAVSFKPTFFDVSWLGYFDSIVDKVEEVTLMGWGEPTLHPDFALFLQWAYKNGLQKYFCTNGTTLHKLKELILDTEVDIIAVSLDGADADTNNRIRRGSDFKKVLNGIKDITAQNKKTPYINFVFTAMRSNINQLSDVVKIASDIGIQEVKVVYLTAFTNDMLDESLYGYKELVSDSFNKAELTAQYYNIDLKLPHLFGEDPAEDAYHKICYTGWRDFFLGSDGYIRPCMSTAEKFFKIEKYKIFEEIWNSQELVKHRKRVNNECMSSYCKKCYQSSFANWNKRDSYIQLEQSFAPIWE